MKRLGLSGWNIFGFITFVIIIAVFIFRTVGLLSTVTSILSNIFGVVSFVLTVVVSFVTWKVKPPRGPSANEWKNLVLFWTAAALLGFIIFNTFQKTPTLSSSDFLRDVRGSPNFADRLISSDKQTIKDGWLPSSTNCSLEEHGYQVHFMKIASCFGGKSLQLSNFALQVSMTVEDGEEAGVIFRTHFDAQGNLTQFYLFYVNTQADTYGFTVGTKANVAGDVIDMAARCLKLGSSQENTLAVIAVGNAIDLYINGCHLDNDGTSRGYPTIINNTSPLGGIGLDVGGDQKIGNFRSVFSNFMVWNYDD